MKSILFAVIAGLLVSGPALADDKTKCPVSGKEGDSAYTSKVTVTIGVCCSKCQAKLEKDDKTQKEALKKYAGTKDSPANAKCIYTNKEIKAANTVKIEKVATFCCDKCKAKFDADPKKYIDKVS